MNIAKVRETIDKRLAPVDERLRKIEDRILRSAEREKGKAMELATSRNKKKVTPGVLFLQYIIAAIALLIVLFMMKFITMNVYLVTEF